MRFSRIHFFIITALLASFVASGQTQDIRIEAEVGSKVIAEGEMGSYTITFYNLNGIPNMTGPRIDGLRFSSSRPSTSQQTQIINGVRTFATSLTWSFTPTRTGEFTIPGRTAVIQDERYPINSVSFEVVSMEERGGNDLFLRLDIPEGPFFLGQAIEASFKIFFDPSVIRIQPVSLPTREGDAFLHKFEEGNPSQSSTSMYGRNYTVVSWDVLITPIKSGSHSLVFEMPLEVSERNQRDPFGNLFSFSFSQSRRLTLPTQDLDLEIVPLPEDERPEAFIDAVGEFMLSHEISTESFQAGEPFSLNIQLKGIGNFERISTPELALGSDWKIYPPKQSFEPSNNLGNRGLLTYEYILIPQTETIDRIPEIQLEYFDPESEEYKLLTIPEKPIEVAPAPVQETSPVYRESNSQNTPPTSLRPIRPDFGLVGNSSTPLYNSRMFWILHLVIAFLLGILIFIRLHFIKLNSDTAYARRLNNSRRARAFYEDARKAAAAGNTSEFFASAVSTLKENIARLNKQGSSAQSLVQEDLTEILRSRDVEDSTCDSIAQFLQKADSVQFAGVHLSEDDLKEEVRQFEKLLKAIPNK